MIARAPWFERWRWIGLSGSVDWFMMAVANGLVCLHIDTSDCTAFGSLTSGRSRAGAWKGKMVRRSLAAIVMGNHP